MVEETNAEEKVTRMEDILVDNPTVTETESSNAGNVKAKIEKKQLPEVPRGKPKSGRVWKEQRKRFSSIIKTRGIRLSLEKKQKLRDDLKRVKEMSRSLKAQKKADKEAKKQRRKENLQRAEENQKKSEIVQVITNTAKLKNIKKKHLRTIQKRDTLNL